MSNMPADAYSAAMADVHAAIASHPAVARLFDPALEPRLLHRFLLEYCALGVQITAPVEGWIRRAGQRCHAVGLPALGDSLIKHAVHEAGHERLFIDDTQRLAAAYTARFGEALDPRALLDQPPTPMMLSYISLHEQVIAGPTPFAQVAIELEIEGLSVSLGPTLLKQIERILGASTLACMTFLSEHVALDVGHTALNKKMLERLIAARPDALPALVDAGSRALTAYLGFLGECMAQAERAIGNAAALRSSVAMHAQPPLVEASRS